jgi:NAD/NADP transhydrogenase beta subunit
MKLKNILGSLAPTLGAAIGGPLGGQAGQILSQVLGVANNPKTIEQAMQNLTADQMVELKIAEKDFEERMAELNVDVFALETEDRQDARSKFSKDWTPRILGVMTIMGFFGYIGMITLYPIDDASDDVVMLIIGSLTGIASAVISFYFGSSNKKPRD